MSKKIDMTSISFHPAAASDYSVIRDLTRENMDLEITKYFGNWNEESFRNDFFPENTIIIRYNNNFVGFFSHSKNGEKKEYLNNIQIKKEFCGQGIGGLALNFFETTMRAGGIESVELRVFPDSKALVFYTKNGYVKNEKNGGKNIQILMKKIL